MCTRTGPSGIIRLIGIDYLTTVCYYLAGAVGNQPEDSKCPIYTLLPDAMVQEKPQANIMDSKKTDISELSEKVLKGLKKAFRKLVETSAARNEELIIGDKHGNFKSVPAKDLLENLPE